MSLITTKTRAASSLDTILANIGAGSVKVYSGSAPADLATGATGTLLAGCTLQTNPPFASTNTTTLKASGALTSAKFAEDTSIDNTGTAGYFRLCDSGGTGVLQGSVGTSSADLILDTTSLTAGDKLTITQFDITIGGIT